MQNGFFFRINGRFIRINFADILYVEGCKNYVKIIAEQKSYLVLITMKRLEQLLPVSSFLRIHKSFIVSLDKIVEFDADTVYFKGRQFPIGQLYKGELEKHLLIINDSCHESRQPYTVNNVPVLHRENLFQDAG